LNDFASWAEFFRRFAISGTFFVRFAPRIFLQAFHRIFDNAAPDPVRTQQYFGGKMTSNSRPSALNHPTRRQVVTGIFVAGCGLIASGAAGGQNADQKMAALPSTEVNKNRTSLHQEIDYQAGPQRIYEALLSSKDFSAFSGAAAEIDPKVGGAFSMFGGLVVGRNVELVPKQRIVGVEVGAGVSRRDLLVSQD
jgi:hypothetical protein